MVQTAMFAIMLSPYPDPATCALCERPTTRHAGPELFLSDSRPACWTCGRASVPELVALLELAAAGRTLFGSAPRSTADRALLPVGSSGRLMSLDDAAARLGMAKRTLHVQISLGQIQTVKLGRRRMVDPRDLEAYVNARRSKPWQGKPENKPHWIPG